MAEPPSPQPLLPNPPLNPIHTPPSALDARPIQRMKCDHAWVNVCVLPSKHENRLPPRGLVLSSPLLHSLSLAQHLILSLCRHGHNCGSRVAKWARSLTPVISIRQSDSAVRIALLWPASTVSAEDSRTRHVAANPGMLERKDDCFFPPPLWTLFKDGTLWMWNESSVSRESMAHLCRPHLFPQEWARGGGRYRHSLYSEAF